MNLVEISQHHRTSQVHCGFDASVLPGLVDVLGAGTCGAETMVAARVCEGAWCLFAACRFV